MATDVTYDDSNLQKLFAELEPRRRAQALKGAFRKSANNVRKRAIENLREKMQSNKDLEKGIRVIVFKRQAGFRATIGTKKAGKNGKGEAGMHTNRRGLKKPVLIWAEEGTKQRATKSSGGRRAACLRSGHNTGSMPKYGFMATARDEMKDSVTEDMRRALVTNVDRISKKYGCK